MAAKTPSLTDDDFLALVQQERHQAIGLDNDDDLADNREQALEYRKGQMDDVRSLPNRSSAVSTDVEDAIQTVLPDLMDIFTSGDEPVAFEPQGEEDEEGAAQETDYINHVVFSENPGFSLFRSHFDDALTCKLGVFYAWTEEWDEPEDQPYEGQPPEAVALLEQQGYEIVDLTGSLQSTEEMPLFDFTARRMKKRGRVRYDNVAPEDFGFARDTVRIADATYCVMRSRPRAQDLIADGYDPDLVEQLPVYGSASDDSLEQARDTAGESDDAATVSTSLYNLHQVEILTHYIRVDTDGDGKPELWCVVTSADESVLLKKERAQRIPFACSTPFPVAHRLLGFSLFDKLAEVQRIKTVLLRTALDSAYFALNQRYEVASEASTPDTINDLLNNVPGAPVRSKNGQAVRALGGGRLDFDVAGMLEYVSTIGEQRSGVVRNAQGLNPDTLHETKGGMEKLFNAAQKRVRMIARVFAETGVKELYLLVHDLARTMGSMAGTVRLRGEWVQIDPSTFGSRKDMTVHVGVGAGGREMELAALNMVAERQAQLVQAQGGGMNGPFVTAQNVYNTAKRIVERAGLKTADLYFTDPAKAPPQPEPPPDPEVVKAQQELELERFKIEQETQLAREKMQAELELAREKMVLEMGLKQTALSGAPSVGDPVRFGGDIG